METDKDESLNYLDFQMIGSSKNSKRKQMMIGTQLASFHNFFFLVILNIEQWLNAVIKLYQERDKRRRFNEGESDSVAEETRTTKIIE